MAAEQPKKIKMALAGENAIPKEKSNFVCVLKDKNSGGSKAQAILVSIASLEKS